MTAYKYVAYTRDGQKRQGTTVADSIADATARLKAEGLFATDLTVEVTSSIATAAVPGSRRRRRLSVDERAVFSRQLASLVSSEIAIDDALRMVGGSSGAPRIAALCAITREALGEGRTLADALARSGAGFPSYYTAAIGAGERSANLATVLDQLATYLEQSSETRAKLASAITYPAFVAVVALLLCGFLVTTVAPQLTALFDTSDQPLPGITLFLLALTDWLESYGLVALGVSIGLTVAFRLALLRPAVRDRWGTLLLRLPVYGRLKRLETAAEYLRTLALLLASRETADQSVRAAAAVLRLSGHRAEGAAVHEAVLRGDRLSDALGRLSVLPPVCLQLIAAGEASTRTAAMTERAAGLIERWLDNDTKRITALMEPILMLIVSGFVLVVVLGILLPIFDLQAVVTGP